jgi:MFS transporter, UMF1 family
MLSAAALAWLREGDWMAASMLFVLGTTGFFGSLVFCDSQLPLIARECDLDRVSAKGCALGYLGGGPHVLIRVLPATRRLRIAFRILARRAQTRRGRARAKDG